MSDVTGRLSAPLADRYRIVRRLGEGGMATVFLAEDLKHDRKIALKVLRPELAAVLGADRFVQEIKSTAQLKHPHILPLYDSGSTASAQGGSTESLYYVMPYIQGETLREKLNREVQLGTTCRPSRQRRTSTSPTARTSTSLGSVLYEMLTGEPPHTGSSAQATIRKIVLDEVRPVSELRRTVSPHMAAAVAKALEELPADRFASARACAEALHNPSPDGAFLVFRNPMTGPGQLYIKRRDEIDARPLAGTEGGSGPFLSPDGAWIGCFANGQLRRVPSSGGASLTLVDSVDPLYNHGAWLADNSIYYYDVRAHSLLRLRSGETKSQVIASPARLEGRFPWLPSPLPDARGILFTAHLTNCVGPVSCRPSRVYAYDARSDSIHALFDDAVGAWYVPTGHVLYLTSSGTLMAAPWDNTKLAATGTPMPILDGVQAPGFVVSDEGTALYLLGSPEFAPGPEPNATFVWVDRSGRVTPVDSAWQVNTGGSYGSGDTPTGWGIALSPDGRRVATTLLTDLGTDIWIKQLPTGPVSRLTLHPGEDRAPAWTPDGRAITFLSDRPIPPDTAREAGRFRLWEQPADGTGEPRLLWGGDAPTDAFPSPDRRWIVLGTTGTPGSSLGADILAAQPGVDSAARRLVATRYDEGGSALSPDARWLAYVSNEQGVHEVFVRPFPDVNAGRWQVSSGGGSAPLWAHNGRELFFVKGNNMHVVRINPGPPFSAEPPRVLFAIPELVRAGFPARGTFALSPDDQRFLMVRDNSWEEMAGTPTMVVVDNFFEELRSKLKK